MTSRDKPFRSKLPVGAGGVPGAHTHPAPDVNSGVLAPARLASGTPAAGKYPDGTGVWTTLPAGGTGDVTGPGSSVNGNLASFSGTSGKVIQDSGIAAAAVATLASVAAAYQPLDSDLTAIAALSTTSYGRNLLTLANQAALTAANANATETLPGIIEIATSGEVAAGTDDARAVTPLKLLGSFGTFATYLGGVYQPLDSDLTTISGLTPTTGNVIQSVGGTWASRTMAQLKVSLAVVVADISDFASAVASAITAERSATATLSGKTLTAPVISSIVNTGTLTLPTSTDTLVGRATTDTLTNKTLTSPTLTTPVLGTPASGNLANCTFPTLNQNTTGSAAKLTTARNINGTAFDGTGNITVTAVPSGSAGGALAGTYPNPTLADAELNALAGLTSATGEVPYFTGSGTASTTPSTSYGRSLLNATNAANGRFILGVPDPIRPGLHYTWDTNTDTYTDPGAGKVRFGDDDLMAVDFTDADAVDRSGYFSNVSHTATGTITVHGANGGVGIATGTWVDIPGTFIQFNMLGYTGMSFANGEAVYIAFAIG